MRTAEVCREGRHVERPRTQNWMILYDWLENFLRPQMTYV